MTTSTSLLCIASRDIHISPATALIQNYSNQSNWAICREIAEEAYWWWCDWFLNEVPIPIGTLKTDRWKWNVENGPSGRWGISTNAQTEENAHISSPPTFLLIKVKVKIKSYEKMKFQSYCYKWHIILINLDKMNAGWKMSRWFWQWTMNAYWTLSRSVSSWYLTEKNTGSWSRQFELCPLFLLQFFSVCNKISPRKHRCESCQALMRNYFSCWRILQRRVIFAGVFYNKDTKKKTLFFQENSTKSSSWPTYGDAVGLKVNHKLLQTPQYDSWLAVM